MKYGLVLEGGGAKGSYQIGAYMAILEYKLDIGAVVGTSIGSLNGAFIVQGKLDSLLEIWKSQALQPEDRVLEALSGLSKKKMMNPRNLAKALPHLGQVDIGPLRKIIDDNLDEDEIRGSEMEYGLVVYSLSERKTKMLFKEDIPQGQLKDYILASCAYPYFTPVRIDGKLYMDGGLGNNLPYQMVEAKGYKPLLLRTNPAKEGEKITKAALVIGPKFPVAKTLDFDPAKAQARMRRGYRQAKRVLEGKDGLDYSFQPFTETQALRVLSNLFLENKEDFRYMADHPSESLDRKILEGLFPILAKELKLNEAYTYKELLLAFLENLGQRIGLNKDKTYSLEEYIFLLRRGSQARPLEKQKTYVQRCQHLIFSTSHHRKELE